MQKFSLKFFKFCTWFFLELLSLIFKALSLGPTSCIDHVIWSPNHSIEELFPSRDEFCLIAYE